MIEIRGALLVGIVLTLLPGAAAAHTPPTALAPFETYADGFADLRGIVVDDTGSVFVADRAAGTVVRITPHGARTVVAGGLQRPLGLALDSSGRLLVAEEGAGRVVRLNANGTRTPLATGIKQPRWLAVRDDGTVYVSARRLTRGATPEPPPEPPSETTDESAEPDMILALSPARRLSVFAEGFKGVQGLALNHEALFVATRGRRHEARVAGEVLHIPILAGGAAGAPTVFGPTDDITKPAALARDRLGALFMTAKEVTLLRDHARRAIAKLHADGHLSVFAENLDGPQGLAFDAAGALFVADGHRVVKFHPPAPPALTAPAVTRLSSVTASGTTTRRARVDVFVNEASSPRTVSADDTGHFVVSVPIAPNATTTLEAFATSHHGDGLTSAPARASVVHDTIPPALAFQAPPPNAHVRQRVSVQATASDAGGLASLVLTLDGDSLGAAPVASPPVSPLVASVTWTTTAAPDGAHTLAATAIDAAGNAATTSRVVVVDNTAPATEITSGPSGSITERQATFGFTGSDNLTPVASLEFAWRLDGGAFSAFTRATSVTLANLGAGPHAFEVKARDRAGNEDPTPPTRRFTVGTLSVTITEPANGARVPQGLIAVRGTVTGATGELDVRINGIAALVQGTTYAAALVVSPDTSTVTVTATIPTGATATHTILLIVSAADPRAPALRALPNVGVAPLAVRFSLLTDLTPATIELDLAGNGAVDFTGATLDEQIFTYATPGVYVPRATVIDETGARFSVATAVRVTDGAGLDGRLVATWTGMKDALRRGAIEDALTFVTASRRNGYRHSFSALASQPSGIDQVLTDISLVEHAGLWSEYQMLRVDDGQELSYFVLFVLGEDGVWRLKFF